MYLWLEVIDIELVWRGTDVAILVPICECNTIKIGYEHVMSEVEFTRIVEEWTIDVKLDNECSLGLLFWMIIWMWTMLLWWLDICLCQFIIVVFWKMLLLVFWFAFLALFDDVV